MTKTTTKWKKAHEFTSHLDNNTIEIDGSRQHGFGPKALLLSGLAGCSGIDIVDILEKMRVQFSNFEIDVEKGGTATITVFNSQGSVQMNQIYKVSEGNQSFNINCNNWTTGLYFIRLKVNETVVTQRVLIQK